MLEKKPDLTVKNKLGKTCIDSAKSKIVINMFSQHLNFNKEITKNVTLNSFDPIRIIGNGSFGEVYLVKRKSTQKYYTMKVLRKKLIFRKHLVKYMLTEKQILSSMKHPFIVSLHCAFQSKTCLYMVMDYYPGGDLGQLLKREGKFSEEVARMYIAEVILAIEDLHKRGIIYRDLKPDNVVLDSEGHIALIDFGLSKEGMESDQLTQSFCGSVAYFAPEMLVKSGHGKAIDWYLVGALLYEMIVGMPPYFTRNK